MGSLKKLRRCRRWPFWVQLFWGILRPNLSLERRNSNGFFKGPLDSPDVFAVKRHNVEMSSQSQVTPSSASPVWQPRKASKRRTCFCMDFRHFLELDGIRLLYFTSIFCLKVGAKSSLGPRELIVGWLLLVGCSPDEFSPWTPSSRASSVPLDPRVATWAAEASVAHAACGQGIHGS